MEDFRKKTTSDIADKDIVYSQAVKAGKRIYYLDVKKNRKDELFLAIREQEDRHGRGRRPASELREAQDLPLPGGFRQVHARVAGEHPLHPGEPGRSRGRP